MMRFLKILGLIVAALALAWFAARNWVPVTVNLWPPYQMVIRLPVLIVGAVLLGWLPTMLAHSLSRWRWRRRLSRTERELQATRSASTATTASAPVPSPSELPPPQAQPLVVPPAGA
jgi:uncharacterized integral membrane protein